MTSVPGCTVDQTQTIEALLLAWSFPASHDNLCQAINQRLGATGGPFDDGSVMQAVYSTLRDHSGRYIPPQPFGQGPGVSAQATQLHSAKAGLSGSSRVKA